MGRGCSRDYCPVGVATRNPGLRARFSVQHEFVETFFEYIGEEVREHLAALGFRSLEEAIGHVQALDPRPALEHWQASGPDLPPLLSHPSSPFCQDLQYTCPTNHGHAPALHTAPTAQTNHPLAAAQPSP